MKISIITPSYNQAQYIEETITSVLEQKGNFELEYIVMDGGSTDGTIEILEKYSEKLIWVSEKDNGQTDAINKGLQKCTGDIIAYLNSDDVYLPGTLEKVVRFFEENPRKKWVSGQCKIIDEKGKEIRKGITRYKNFWLQFASYNYLLAENYICQPATFWKREVFDEIGLFDEKQHLVMDYEYWLRVGKKFSLGVLNERLALFRWYTDSKSGSLFVQQFQDELAVAKKYADGKVWPLVLHRLNMWKIILVYKCMRGLGW